MQIDIPGDKRDRIKAAMKGLYKIPLIPDPDFVGEGAAPHIPEFTDDEWMKEAIIRWIKNAVHRWEASTAITVARDSILVDDTLVS